MSISSHLPVISESSHIQRMDNKQLNKININLNQTSHSNLSTISQSYHCHLAFISHSSQSHLLGKQCHHSNFSVIKESKKVRNIHIYSLILTNDITFISKSIPVISQSSQGILKVISKQRTSIL